MRSWRWCIWRLLGLSDTGFWFQVFTLVVNDNFRIFFPERLFLADIGHWAWPCRLNIDKCVHFDMRRGLGFYIFPWWFEGWWATALRTHRKQKHIAPLSAPVKKQRETPWDFRRHLWPWATMWIAFQNQHSVSSFCIAAKWCRCDWWWSRFR